MRKLSTWLIIAGCIIILIPIIGSIYTSYQQDKLYQEFINNQELANSKNAMDSAFSSGSETTDSSTSSAAGSGKGTSYKPVVIGRIKIPSVSINLLLVEGSTANDLNWGAGHLTGTPMPGETGNSAIAGHRNYTFGSYFSQLGEVQIGDTINVEYNQTIFTYEVTEILTVLPDDTTVLAQPENDSILTLITCTPKGSNTHRLIIHAKLIPAT